MRQRGGDERTGRRRGVVAVAAVVLIDLTGTKEGGVLHRQSALETTLTTTLLLVVHD